VTVFDTNTSSGAARAPILAPICTALSGVDARTNVNAEFSDRVHDCPSAANGTRRTIKRCQEAVSGSVNFAAPMPRELVTGERVMLSKKIFPTAVSKLDYPGGSVNDIREEYAGEYTVVIGFNFSATAGRERFNLTQD
jgi:hypothetical protein